MDKNYLLSFSCNRRNDFPNELVTEDSLRYRELLFEDSLNNDLDQSNRGLNDMSEAYIIENENMNNKKIVKPQPKISNPQPNKGKWRQNPAQGKESNLGNDTVNFLREGVTNNKSEVENFVRGKNKENIQSKNEVEDTFNVDVNKNNCGNLNDTMKESVNIGNVSDMSMGKYNEYFKEDCSKNVTEDSMNSTANNNTGTHPSPNNFDPRQVGYPYMARGVPFPFTPMMPMGMIPNMPNMQTMPNMSNMQAPAKEKVKIENIFLFNDKINFPKDQPLWYIVNTWPTLVLTGPLSSNQMVDFYSKNMFDGNFGFRPLDIFHFKNINANKNDIAKLKTINNDNWTDDLFDSPLLQYTELYSTSKKLLDTHSPSNSKKKEKEVNSNHSDTLKAAIVKKELPKHVAPFQEETLQLTQIDNKNELKNFMADTEIIGENKNDVTTVINIVKQIDDLDTNWEVVDKKKKKQKEVDDSFYLVGVKPKKDVKKEVTKPTTKVDIIPPEELVKNLMPKHLREENKPNYEAFNPNKESNQNKAGKKKMKGKPQDLNVKLGFKI